VFLPVPFWDTYWHSSTSGTFPVCFGRLDWGVGGGGGGGEGEGDTQVNRAVYFTPSLLYVDFCPQ